MSDGYIVRAVVRHAHGVGGLVFVGLNTDYPERLLEADSLLLRFRGQPPQPMRVERASPHKSGLLVKFEGVGDRDAAQALCGAEVVVPLDELPPLPEGEYYWHQLIGLRVVTVDGEEVGTIREILRTGSNDVYITERPLIPAIADVVERVDLEAGELVIRPMPGLLDR